MNNDRDSYYRYPGSRPFYDTEIDRLLFFGRDKETKLLLHEILTSTLVVLYGKSGLGKTSLINAGLNQELRNRKFVPLKIRFNDTRFEPLQAVYGGIEDIAAKNRLDYEAGEKESLWQFFKTAAFWGDDNTLLKPVLILDQFEEFFALHSPAAREKFTRHLADLVNNTIPFKLRRSVLAGEPFPYSDKPPNVKILISIREDYLGQLEEMAVELADILHHRVRLLPLSCKQARQAIVEPSRVDKKEVIPAGSFQYSPEAVDMMVNFLCKRKEKGIERITDEVESFQLQLLCSHLEDKVRKKPGKGKDGPVVEKDDLGGEKGMTSVLQRFYDDQVKQLDSALKRYRARKLCERGLISVENRRLSLEEREIELKYKVTESLLSELVDRRLLRSEPRVGSIYYELSHDTLVAPIRESQKKRNFKKGIILSVIIGIFIILAMGFFIQLGEKNQMALRKKVNKLYVDAETQKNFEKYSQAEETYNALLKIDKNNANVYFELGYVHHKRKKYNDAIDAYKKAIAIDPEFILPKINLAAVYLAKEEFETADNLASEVLKEKSIPPQYILTMRLVSISSLLIQQKHRELIEQLNKFIAYYTKLSKNYEKNLDYLLPKELISTFPLSEERKELLFKFIDILDSPLEEGQRKLKESEHFVWNIKGNAHLTLEKWDKAIEAFNKAIEIRPKYNVPKVNLAAVYLIRKEYEKAGKLAKEVLEDETAVERRLVTMGISIASLQFQGKKQQAKEQFREFIDYYNSLTEDYKKSWNYKLAKKRIGDQPLPIKQKLYLFKFLDILESPLAEGRKKIAELETLIR